MTRVAGSNYSAAKQAIVSALTGRAGLSGIQVSYSTPDKIETSSIFFDDDRDADIDSTIRVMTGSSSPSNPHRVRETVALPLSIQAVEVASVQAADTAAVALLAEVQQAFAENSQMVPGAMWVQLRGGPVRSSATGQRRYFCRMDLTVELEAELYPD